MRNDIAKQIINCRSGKEGVARILNSVSLSSGTLGGETTGLAVAATDYFDYRDITTENPLYEALNHVKVSRMFYQSVPESWVEEHGHVPNTVACPWYKSSSNGYNQVCAEYGWSDPVDELPEGAESSGDKVDAEPSEETYEQWYEDTTGEGEAEETVYYQVVIDELYWGETLTKNEFENEGLDPDSDVEGVKSDSALTEENLGLWFVDISGVKKCLQDMILTPNPINTSIIYKQLDVTQEDIDDLNDSGEYGEFLEWVTKELRRSVEKTIIDIMISDLDFSNFGLLVTRPDAIWQFNTEYLEEHDPEGIFTSVGTLSEDTTIDDIYSAVNDVASDHKWLVMSSDRLNILLGLMSPTADKYSLASRLNVDYVYVTESVGDNIICLDPDEFWLREKNVLEVAYPVYDYNKVTFLYEMNVGIRPHKPYSSMVMVPN